VTARVGNRFEHGPNFISHVRGISKTGGLDSTLRNHDRYIAIVTWYANLDVRANEIR